MQYIDISNLLAVKRGRRTFEDVVKSQGADAAQTALDVEITSVQKVAKAASDTLSKLRVELKQLLKNHDTDKPLKKFREAFKELLVIADVPEFGNAATWKLSKRPTDSGSPGPRSVVAYYGALWTVMQSPNSFLPCPIVIDSPNQNAQDRKHLERVMGMLASKTPVNAQVILCAEDPSDAFKPDQVIQLDRERELLEFSQMDEVSARILPLVERAIAELASVTV